MWRKMCNFAIVMSKTRNLLHIVFATKHRQQTIPEAHKKELYSYIFGIVKQNNCFLHRMNGISNHIHMLIDLNPMVSLANLVRDIKRSTSIWLKSNPDFPEFQDWAEGYFAASLGVDELEACKTYIINQESHHYLMDLQEELDKIMAAAHLEFHPNDLG